MPDPMPEPAPASNKGAGARLVFGVTAWLATPGFIMGLRLFIGMGISLGMGWGLGAASAAETPPNGREVPPEVAWIEALYQEGDAYRAESEIMRWLHQYPTHQVAPWAELARAKLYYRARRYQDTRMMIISLLDRYPRHRVALPGFRLLSYTEMRLGNYRVAAASLPRRPVAGYPAPVVPSPAAMQAPPGSVDPEAAVAWSTWLPGAGYFMVGEPGKGMTALGLNLGFLAATVNAYRQDLKGAALLFLLIEATLYQGQRNATRQAATRHNQRLREANTQRLLVDWGEPELLKVGMSWGF